MWLSMVKARANDSVDFATFVIIAIIANEACTANIIARPLAAPPTDDVKVEH